MPTEQARTDAILGERLFRQGLLGNPLREAGAVVTRLTAIQAQEFDDVCRAVAHRVAGAPSAATVADRIASGDIVRTHVLRPTWHLALASEIDWLLELTAPRIHRQAASMYRREGIELPPHVTALELTLEHATEPLTRKEIQTLLADRGVVLTAAGVTHLTFAAELERIAITGPRRGRMDTYVSYRSRVPVSDPLDRGDAVAVLAHRFLDGHAPATLRDFVWWSGLTLTDARSGFAAAGAMALDDSLFTLDHVGATARGTALLLSLFDEYVIAYADRSLMEVGSPLDVWGNNVIVVDGRLAGGWRIVRPKRKDDVLTIELSPARPLSRRERDLLDAEADRISATLDAPSTTRWNLGG